MEVSRDMSTNAPEIYPHSDWQCQTQLRWHMSGPGGQKSSTFEKDITLLESTTTIRSAAKLSIWSGTNYILKISIQLALQANIWMPTPSDIKYG